MSWIPPTMISPLLLPSAGAVDERDIVEAIVSSLKHSVMMNVLLLCKQRSPELSFVHCVAGGREHEDVSSAVVARRVVAEALAVTCKHLVPPIALNCGDLAGALVSAMSRDCGRGRRAELDVGAAAVAMQPAIMDLAPSIMKISSAHTSYFIGLLGGAIKRYDQLTHSRRTHRVQGSECATSRVTF